MKSITRRHFVQSTAAAAATIATISPSRVLGANNTIRLGIVGVRGKGFHHIRDFRDLPGVQIAGVCDVDPGVLNRAVKEQTDNKYPAPRKYNDMRKMFDDKSIDAVVIATPNHWHALATIWACQAGKDVYVEKPISHNVWEGRQEAEAARKYKRVVVSGTQKRSDPAAHQMIEILRSGKYGKIKCARALNYKRRGSIGSVKGPTPVPPNIDFDQWTGPAPLEPLMRKSLHYDWHWVWQHGNGDIGNQGPHQIDVCRWALGVEDHPKNVICVGGRFGYDDDATTPNTQIAMVEYDNAPPLLIEVRGLPVEKDRKAMDRYKGMSVGYVIECEHGYFSGFGPGWFYDNDGKRVEQVNGDGGKDHQLNFIKAVRSRKEADNPCNADIGHVSATVHLLANISYRCASATEPQQVRQQLGKNEYMTEMYDRMIEHLEKNQVDLEQSPVYVGPQMKFDGKTEQFSKGQPFAVEANGLLTREYRHPYIVPREV